MFLFFIISNFVINIIFLILIIYFIIVLSKKQYDGNNYQSHKEVILNNNYKVKKDEIPKSKSNLQLKDTNNNLHEKQKEIPKNKQFVYDYNKCMDCIDRNNKSGIMTNCPHCGSENYDTGCVPTILYEGKPKNCIPKELSPEKAYWACKGSSNSMQSCTLINPNKMLEYQKEECKREDGEYDYYCAYDETDSCSYNLCNLNDYYSYGSSSICNCEKSPNEKLPKGFGRECKKGLNCKEYHSRKLAPELLSDPGLKRFYGGYSSYMDVPKLDKWYSALIANSQTI